MAVNWAGAMESNDRLWGAMNQNITKAFGEIKEARKRQSLMHALDGLEGPDPQTALREIYSLSPQLGMQMEDQLFQRTERDRAAQFREGAAGILLGGGKKNALLPAPEGPGGGLGPSMPRPAPPEGAMGPGAGGASPPNPQMPDINGGLQQLEPRREHIIKGAEIIRQMNPTDQPSWDATRAAAAQAGIDISGVPAQFDPQVVQSLVALADHMQQQSPEGIVVTGQRPGQAISPDYERAVRADPEKFLMFQGKQTEITEHQFKIAKDVNSLSMQLLGGVHDQASYDAAKEQAAALYARFGQDFSQVHLPDEWSPELIRDLQMKGMDTAKQLAGLARENRLEADMADDRADNARADRNTDSLINSRRQRLQQSGKPKPAPQRTPKEPTPSTVIGKIMDKEAKGLPLAAGERRMLDAYNNHGRGKGRGSSSAGSPVRVNSIEEARRLPPGTVFITPDGRQKVR